MHSHQSPSSRCWAPLEWYRSMHREGEKFPGRAVERKLTTGIPLMAGAA